MFLSKNKDTLGQNHNDIRVNNRAFVYQSIYNNPGITRAAIARKFGLTPSTITNIIKSFINNGLVFEGELKKSIIGRPSIGLQICPDKAYIVGVYIARYWVSFRVTDLSLTGGKIVTEEISSLSNDVQMTIDYLSDGVLNLIEEFNIPKDKVVGVGICAPGPLNVEKGQFTYVPNFEGWEDVPIKSLIENKVGIPTKLDKDSSAAALAENMYGAGRNMNDFAFFLVDSGVGCGIVLHNELYHGYQDMSGEIGHSSINFIGPQCDCGNYGCLELYASPRHKVEIVKELIRNNKASIIQDWIDGDVEKITFDDIVKAAYKNDPLSLDVIKEIGEALAVGITNMMHILDPEAFIIGGLVMKAGDLLLDIINKSVDERCLAKEKRKTKIIFTELGEEAPIIGSQCIVLQEVFKNPEFYLSTQKPRRK